MPKFFYPRSLIILNKNIMWGQTSNWGIMARPLFPLQLPLSMAPFMPHVLDGTIFSTYMTYDDDDDDETF